LKEQGDMEVDAIRALRGRLGRYLDAFDGCFGRREPAGHLRTYMEGQLSDLPRKSIEPMALHSGTPPRTLQQFLSGAHWDQHAMRDTLQQEVAARWSHRDAIGIIDETSFAKKGRCTPGVKHQYCGSLGKQNNCTVTVHLAYSAPGGFRSLIDGELFLPEDWSLDRDRCRKAGIPEDMVYRPKWKIALELRDRAVANGVTFPWMTFDEGYGLSPQFHLALDRCGQRYVCEVPKNFFGWCKPPKILLKAHHPGSVGELKAKSLPASRVDDLAAHSPALYRKKWQRFRIKESDKGPIVWEAKVAPFQLSCEGRPSRRLLLIAARNLLNPKEVKYFVSNAPATTPLAELLRVGFGRYPVERCFEDDKTEIGLDHFEVRNYRSLQRHLILSSASLLFLAQVRQEDVKKKSRIDGLPGSNGGQRDDRFADDGQSGRPTAA
jgi:SRSO17 transposase